MVIHRSRSLRGRSLALVFLALSGVGHRAPATDLTDGRLLLRSFVVTAPLLKGPSGLALGSFFSDLYRDNTDPPGVFWGVTDRGPNEEPLIDGLKRRTFLDPGFNPAIVKLRVEASITHVEAVIPLRGARGERVTGLPNLETQDERPFDRTGQKPIAYDALGVDPEGLVRLRDGSFVIAEEYGPSLLFVSREGRIVRRVTPIGGERQASYPVEARLPAILLTRRPNRGFEALALSADETRLYAMTQSPLSNPEEKTGSVSRLVRIFTFETTTLRVLSEHVIVLEPASDYGETRPSDVKISGAIAVGPHRLLIDERTDRRGRIYAVDLASGTDIAGSLWDTPGGSPTLESLGPAELLARGVRPVHKTLLLDLSRLVPDAPEKIEGIALVDDVTLVLGNDNEFGLPLPGGTPAQSQLLFIRFSAPVR